MFKARMGKVSSPFKTLLMITISNYFKLAVQCISCSVIKCNVKCLSKFNLLIPLFQWKNYLQQATVLVLSGLKFVHYRSLLDFMTPFWRQDFSYYMCQVLSHMHHALLCKEQNMHSKLLRNVLGINLMKSCQEHFKFLLILKL